MSSGWAKLVFLAFSLLGLAWGEETCASRVAELRLATPLDQARAALAISHPELETARESLLSQAEVVAYRAGGLGFTFALKMPSGETVRYKGPKRVHSRGDQMEADRQQQMLFKREANLAIKAGRLGLGPKAEWDSTTGLLKMENIDGRNLLEAKSEVDEMDSADREAWLQNVSIAIVDKLETLHQSGVAHLDLKPENILIPDSDPSGRTVYLIDYGTSLTAEEIQTRAPTKYAYVGTLHFQGKNSLTGRPGMADDLDSLRIFLEFLYARKTSRIDELDRPFPLRSFVKSRPELRSLFALWSEPQAGKGYENLQGSYALFRLAVKPNLNAEERKRFWEGFHSRFSARSYGQQVAILASEPAIISADGLGPEYSDVRLRRIIDAGMRENDWAFDDSTASGIIRRNIPAVLRMAEMNRLKQRWGVNLDLKRLRDLRLSLGEIPRDLKAESVASSVEPVTLRESLSQYLNAAYPAEDPHQAWDPSPLFSGKRKALRDSHESQKLRRRQLFRRTPTAPNSPEFIEASRAANDHFNRWLDGQFSYQSLSELMDSMHERYRSGEDDAGKIREAALGNSRGKLTRDFVKKYFGLTPLPNGRVKLPGIPWNMSPEYGEERFSYPALTDPKVTETYYRALESKIAEYSHRVEELQQIETKEGRKSAAYREKENEALGVIVDFGRIAASFRQYPRGNWGLYGPMINYLLNRIGREIREPGYLDVIFQGATEESLKPWFTRMVREGEAFYPADGFNPVSPRPRFAPRGD